MTTLKISSEEQELLDQLVQHALATLEVELRHTDHLEFREMLKRRRELLNQLAGKLEGVAVPNA